MTSTSRYRSFPRETQEYVPVFVEGDGSFTSLPVKMCILLWGTRPEEADWQAAVWDSEDDLPFAKILMGPGTLFDFSEAPGTYIPWVRITATTEQPVIEGDPIRIT